MAYRRRGGEIVMKHPFLKGFIIIDIIKLCPRYDASVSINEFNIFEGTQRVGLRDILKKEKKILPYIHIYERKRQ